MEVTSKSEEEGRNMEPNELITVSAVLANLEKRLYLLRASLSEIKDIEKLREKFRSGKTSVLDDGNELTVLPSSTEYKLVLDCCDIETSISRVLRGLEEFGTFEVLKEVVQEYEEANASFEKHQKTLVSKREEIAEQKKVLSAIQEAEDPLSKLREDIGGDKGELSSHNLSIVKQWMECQIDSKKEFYEYLVSGVRENIESYIREVELLLRKIFDEWAERKRDMAVLKKYRKLNLDKIERVTKQIAIREEVIQADWKKKEIVKQREREEMRKHAAATIIQAYWRGTMVRKHLGRYKIKKKKKGKKGKKGKKKGKGKK